MIQFEDDWLIPSVQKSAKYGTSILWEFNVKEVPEVSKAVMLDAVQRMSLGDKPCVSLSGGVDSQAVCLLLKEAGIDFSIVIMRFRHGFNDMDVDSAVNFCKAHGFEYDFINVDLYEFLMSEERDYYAERYDCPSPQFNTHFYFFDLVRKKHSPSSILCGGQFPILTKDSVYYSCSKSRHAWTNYALWNDFALYGNFLSWSKDIALPLTMACNDPFDDGDQEGSYESKILRFHRLGINVIQQDSKYTGFEKFKIYLERKTGDPLYFENRFRIPYNKTVGELYPEVKIDLLTLENINNKSNTFNKR